MRSVNEPTAQYSPGQGSSNKKRICLQLSGEGLKCTQSNFTQVYELNGCFYLTDIDFFNNNKRFVSDKCLPFVMDKTKSLNLDTKDDVILMEHYLSNGVLKLTTE